MKTRKQRDGSGIGLAGLEHIQPWKLEEAKARFSEVVRLAQGTPQRVTVHGKDAVVVVSSKAFARLLPEARIGLGDLMASSPLGDVAFGEKGAAMPVRNVEL